MGGTPECFQGVRYVNKIWGSKSGCSHLEGGHLGKVEREVLGKKVNLGHRNGSIVSSVEARRKN